jgi:hypothetical protein
MDGVIIVDGLDRLRFLWLLRSRVLWIIVFEFCCGRGGGGRRGMVVH